MSSPTVSQVLQAGLVVSGRVAARAGRAMVDAYQSVDPDVMRHLAQLPLAGLSLVIPKPGAVQALPDDGHRPIIFVHGLGGAAGNFMPMRLYFALMGRKRTYAVDLGTGTPARMATRLRAFIDQVVKKNGLKPRQKIDVVAHSMGGLIVRLALMDKATRARVATLITLGTPHGGTHAARFAATQHALALRPNSRLFKTLAHQSPWKRGWPELICLWSTSDMLLLPATTACMEGAKSVEMSGFTHYSYLILPTGWRAVQAALTT